MKKIDTDKLLRPDSILDPHVFKVKVFSQDDPYSDFCDICGGTLNQEDHVEGQKLYEKGRRRSARIISQMNSVHEGKSIAVPKVSLICFWSAFIINVVYHNFIK